MHTYIWSIDRKYYSLKERGGREGGEELGRGERGERG